MEEQLTAAGNAIELKIDAIAQLFHSLDPFPFREKDLDEEAEEFIVSWARELPPDLPLKIIVHMPERQLTRRRLGSWAQRLPDTFRIVPG